MLKILENYTYNIPLVWQALICCTLFFLYLIGNFFTQRIFLKTIQAIISKTRSAYDDVFYENRVFHYIAHIIPTAMVYLIVPMMPKVNTLLATAIQRISLSMMLIWGAVSFSAFLTALHQIYASHPKLSGRPIKGYFQLVKLIVFLICGILVISILLDRSPWIFISSLGALTAVLLLVFKDTILSLVASIQLTSHSLIHLGDWLEVPKYGADGDVIDISLHTIRIQNFDKTITTIPTHKLIEDTFKNWRGMSKFGARRIKRSLFINLNSIRFLNREDIDKLSQYQLLKDYIAGKKTELKENLDKSPQDALVDNSRKLTNIGTFRHYVKSYLRNHKKISQNTTLLVRQLQPTANGLPIEIYIFADETRWIEYEEIQADLFDHILSVVKEFDLSLFQNPSGQDFQNLKI